MITGYSKPQLNIQQNLAVILAAAQTALAALVFGPRFFLSRYTNAAERAKMSGTLFVENTNPDPGVRQLLPYENITSTLVVDSAFVQVFAENIEAQLWLASSPTLNDTSSTAPYQFNLPSLQEPNKIKVTRRGARLQATYNSVTFQMDTITVLYAGSGYAPSSTLDVPVVGGSPGAGAWARLTIDGTGIVASGVVITSGTGYTGNVVFDAPYAGLGANVGTLDATLIPPLYGRPVQAGDIIYPTFNSQTIRRVVTSVEQEKEPSTFGTDADSDDKLFSASAVNPPLAATASAPNNISAPAGWNIFLSHTTLIGATVTAGGSAYVTAPTVVVDAPPTISGALSWPSSTALAHSVIVGGVVTAVVIDDPGAGYVDGGVISLTISGGSGYLTTPTINLGAPAAGGKQATAVAIVVGGSVTGYKITDPGSGYGSAPSVSFVGGSPSVAATATSTVHAAPALTFGSGAATAVPIINSKPTDWNGLVQGSSYNGQYGEKYIITITSAGTGAPGSAGGTARIRSASGGFSADNVTILHEGFGYTLQHASLGGIVVELRYSTSTQPLVIGQQFSFVVYGLYNPVALNAAGQVTALNIINGGTLYGSGDTITLAAPPTGGVQATATITESGGTFISFKITNPGSGYIHPPKVFITTSTGSEAILDSVLSVPENSAQLALIQSGSYSGPVNTQYKLTVIQGVAGTASNPYGGAIVKITDSAGVDTIQQVTITEGVVYNLGTYGLQFMFPALPAPVAATVTGGHGGGLATVASFTGGSGYTSVPNVVISGGSGTGATAVAEVADGVVVDVIITSGGSGYTANPTITIDPPVTYQVGLRTGDSYYVNAVAAAATGAKSIIVTNGQVVDTTGWVDIDVPINLLNIDYRLLYTGEVPLHSSNPQVPAYSPGTTQDGGVFLTNTLQLDVTSRTSDNQWVPIKNSTYGRLFVQWRGLIPALVTDGLVQFTNTDDIIAAHGAYDPENPLCYGACIAMKASGTVPIWVGAVQTNDIAGYTALLAQAERVDGATYLAGMTDDLATQQLIEDHVDKMSANNVMRWRRAYVATQNPGPYGVILKDASGNAFSAQVLGTPSGNVRVVCPNGTFITADILPGDLYRTNFSTDAWGNQTFDSYVVANVLDNGELILVTGPVAPISPAINFQIWRPDTGLTQAQFVGNRSESFQDRRVSNVWSDSPVTHDAAGNPIVVDPMFIAAEIAGIRASVLPQQGLTNTAITLSVDSAPTMYTKYTDANLDVAAENGTMVVTQDVPGGPVYIRHQLTTQTNSGPLYYEDSVGVNFDALSYAIRNKLLPYIGRTNVTPETLQAINTDLRAILDASLANPQSLSNIGPAVLAYSNLTVKADAVRKDRINWSVTCELPLPTNSIIGVLNGTVASDSTLNSLSLTIAA